MKKITFTGVIIFVFCGCGTMLPNGYEAFSHSALYYEADTRELFGTRGDVFQGRVYEIRSGGNAYMSRNEVKGFAMWAAGKAAFDNGYKEFSILVEDGDVSKYLQSYGYTNKYGYTSNSYTVTKYGVILIVLLITDEDYSYIDNIYLAEKYYSPGSEP
jgi:hypothetical protein